MVRYDLSEPDYNLTSVINSIVAGPRAQRGALAVSGGAEPKKDAYLEDFWPCPSDLLTQALEVRSLLRECEPLLTKRRMVTALTRELHKLPDPWVEDPPLLYQMALRLFQWQKRDLELSFLERATVAQIHVSVHALWQSCLVATQMRLRACIAEIRDLVSHGGFATANRLFMDIRRNLLEGHLAFRVGRDEQFVELLHQVAELRSEAQYLFRPRTLNLADSYSAAIEHADTRRLTELGSAVVPLPVEMGIGSEYREATSPVSVSPFRRVWNIRRNLPRATRLIHENERLKWNTHDQCTDEFVNAVKLNEVLERADVSDLSMLWEMLPVLMPGNDLGEIDPLQEDAESLRRLRVLCMDSRNPFMAKAAIDLMLPVYFAFFSRGVPAPVVHRAARILLPVIAKLDSFGAESCQHLARAAALIAPDCHLSFGEACQIFIQMQDSPKAPRTYPELGTWMRNQYGLNFRFKDEALFSQPMYGAAYAVANMMRASLGTDFVQHQYSRFGLLVPDISLEPDRLQKYRNWWDIAQRPRVPAFEECEWCIPLFGLEWNDDFKSDYEKLLDWRNERNTHTIRDRVIRPKAREILDEIADQGSLGKTLAVRVMERNTGCPAIVGKCVARLVVKQISGQKRITRSDAIHWLGFDRPALREKLTKVTEPKSKRAESKSTPKRIREPLGNQVAHLQDSLRQWGLAGFDVEQPAELDRWTDDELSFVYP
ncbi:MAG TPA: hypothetical protein VGL38_05910 [bacterium]|jgi:hypothetical protein